MSPLTNDQVQALRELTGIWPGRFALVGAAALICQMPSLPRHTNDIDVSVAISLSDLTADLEKLSGWERNPRLEHEWYGPGSVKVDFIPAGPELLAAGEITWPSGHTMSLLGLRHAFERATSLEVASGLMVSVAAIPAIALMKMVAYQERPDRIRDLTDLAHILEHYAAGEDERRYSDDVHSAAITFEQVSAFLLGRDLAEVINEQEAQAIERFMRLVRGEIDGGRTEAIMLQQAPAYWRHHPEELSAKADALARGLGTP